MGLYALAAGYAWFYTLRDFYGPENHGEVMCRTNAWFLVSGDAFGERDFPTIYSVWRELDTRVDTLPI